eukprot:2467636-Pyramimonas_sp.AAC.1
MPVPMQLEATPTRARAPCSAQTISALRHATATSPLARPTEITLPGQPGASFVLGGQWISTWPPYVEASISARWRVSGGRD